MPRSTTGASGRAPARTRVRTTCGSSTSSNPSWDKPLQLPLNPDVSLREVGVMEKCTFCVQRIKGATIQAKAEERARVDGELQTACAQACPANALVFGDLDDPESAVARLSRSPRGTTLLEDLGTQPKVAYLSRQA